LVVCAIWKAAPRIRCASLNIQEGHGEFASDAKHLAILLRVKFGKNGNQDFFQEERGFLPLQT